MLCVLFDGEKAHELEGGRASYEWRIGKRRASTSRERERALLDQSACIRCQAKVVFSSIFDFQLTFVRATRVNVRKDRAGVVVLGEDKGARITESRLHLHSRRFEPQDVFLVVFMSFRMPVEAF